MKSKKLKISLLFIVFIFMVASFSIYELDKSTIASAEANYFSVENYTDNDRLLQDDGTLSNKKISDFASEVKSASSGTSFPELTEVIPRQYLETTETDAVFQYNGKEYGFYIAKEGERFDILLIDFIYEFESEHSELEYKIQIKPVLQQSFVRSLENNSYVYKTTDEGYTYYIANPSFMTILQNENALNYGDKGYTKESDDGLIIIQSRANYGKISYKTEGDLAASVVKIMANVFLDSVVDILDTYTGNIIGNIKDAIEYTYNLYVESKETTIVSDNEQNIFTEQSKTNQLNNSDLDGYSRVSAFVPVTELILSEDLNSYAEFITMLNDTNYSSRLIQLCNFNITRRDDPYSSMEYITDENGDAEIFSFSNQKVLFEEYGSESITSETPVAHNQVYLLSGGTQKFYYTPAYSENYIFTCGDDVTITIDGVNYNPADEIYLERNNKYVIVLTSDNRYQGYINLEIADVTEDIITLKSNGYYIGRFVPTNSVFYSFYADSGSYLQILDSDYKILAKDDVALDVKLVAGETYYVVLKNSSTVSKNFNLLISETDVAKITTLQDYYIDLSSGCSIFYMINIDVSGEYDFNFQFTNISDIDTSNFSIYIYASNDDEYLNYKQGIDEGFYLCRVTLSDVYEYYIQIIANIDIEAKLNCNLYTDSYIWYIDGEKYINGTGITRGEEHSVEIYNSALQKVTGKILSVGSTYADFTDLSIKNGIYYFTIDSDAKMYNNKLTYFCQLYTLADINSNIYIEFPVITQFDMDIDIISLSEFDEVPEIAINNICADSDEAADIYVKYTFDSYSTVFYDSLAINYSGSYYTYFDLSVIDGYKQTYFNINMTILRIEYYDKSESSIIKGIVYNSYIENDANSIYIEPFTVGIHFQEGTGTKDDPYIISNYLQFNHLSYAADSSGIINGYFKVTSINYWGAKRCDPFNLTFNGTLTADNENNEIRIPVNGALDNGDVALFYKIGSNGVIKNLKIYITYYATADASTNNFGGFAIYNCGKIENCTVSGMYGSSHINTSYVGGIVTYNYGTISGCSISSFIYGGNYIGGIAAVNTGTITKCDVSAYIYLQEQFSDNDVVGGIVAYMTAGKVTNCTFSGTITVLYQDSDSRTLQPYIGGIVGYKTGGTVSDNTSTGTLNVSNLNEDVSWWSWFKTYHFNQQEYVGETIGKDE